MWGYWAKCTRSRVFTLYPETLRREGVRASRNHISTPDAFACWCKCRQQGECCEWRSDHVPRALAIQFDRLYVRLRRREIAVRSNGRNMHPEGLGGNCGQYYNRVALV